MAKLNYSGIASLDGYIADENGRFDWAEPDGEVHAFINDLERDSGTYLYGRRMYEVMRAWESSDFLTGQPPFIRDYAELWQAADKIVFSKTLEVVSTARTRIEREFDPSIVVELKASSEQDISIGGPGLAANAIRAGLVDEYRLFVVPHVVGGGTRFLPSGVRLALELLDERRFASGMVHLRYRPKDRPTT